MMKLFYKILIVLLICAALLPASGCLSRGAGGEVRPVELPKAAVTAKTLLLTEYPALQDAFTLGSLQGVLANTSPVQILIRDGDYQGYLPLKEAAAE